MRSIYCRRGHFRTEKNTTTDGKCRMCKSIRERRRYVTDHDHREVKRARRRKNTWRFSALHC